jgi:hypothetical protein
MENHLEHRPESRLEQKQPEEKKWPEWLEQGFP